MFVKWSKCAAIDNETGMFASWSKCAAMEMFMRKSSLLESRSLEECFSGMVRYGQNGSGKEKFVTNLVDLCLIPEGVRNSVGNEENSSSIH